MRARVGSEVANAAAACTAIRILAWRANGMLSVGLAACDWVDRVHEDGNPVVICHNSLCFNHGG